jgi:hypothetical protein
VEREAEKQSHEKWPRKTFDEGLGISVGAFLEALRDAEFKYTPAADLLKQKQVKISRDRVRNLTQQLYNDYPDIYDKYRSIPPQGLAARAKGKIISIDSWKN